MQQYLAQIKVKIKEYLAQIKVKIKKYLAPIKVEIKVYLAPIKARNGEYYEQTTLFGTNQWINEKNNWCCLISYYVIYKPIVQSIFSYLKAMTTLTWQRCAKYSPLSLDVVYDSSPIVNNSELCVWEWRSTDVHGKVGRRFESWIY